MSPPEYVELGLHTRETLDTSYHHISDSWDKGLTSRPRASLEAHPRHARTSSLQDMELLSEPVWSLSCNVPVEHLVILRPEEAVSFLMEEEEPLMSFGPSVLGTRGPAQMNPIAHHFCA